MSIRERILQSSVTDIRSDVNEKRFFHIAGTLKTLSASFFVFVRAGFWEHFDSFLSFEE